MNPTYCLKIQNQHSYDDGFARVFHEHKYEIWSNQNMTKDDIFDHSYK